MGNETAANWSFTLYLTLISRTSNGDGQQCGPHECWKH